jgi:hypothetical protein
MSYVQQRLPAILFTSVLLAIAVAPFQNCSRANFQNNSSESTDPKLGGGGVDGKMYSSYGNCVPQKIDVVSSLVISDNMKNAWMVRESCQDLAVPKVVDTTQLKIASDDNRTVMLGDRVFTLNSFSDGLTSAPLANVQKPGLLNAYPLRPVWKVAGVDYAVGMPNGTVLKNPASIALAGVAVDTVAHEVVVTGNNVTLDSYDFSLNGGWSVQINGAANTRIVNSLFVESASQGQAPIVADAATTNLYVGYSTIDGGGTNANPAQGTLIMMNGRGLVTEYCWLKNAPSNIFIFGYGGVGGGGSAIIRFNLVEDSGRRSGGGGSYLSIFSGSYNHFQVVFNTSYQTPGGTGAAGWNMDAPAIQTAEVGNNTMISTAPGAASYLMSSGASAGGAVLHDNYFDLSGAFGFAYPGTGAWANYKDNFDMKTAQPLPNNP